MRRGNNQPPLTESVTIKPDHGPTNAKVAAEFYHQAKLLGKFRVDLKVWWPSPVHRSKSMRADCVCSTFAGTAFLFVECKGNSNYKHNPHCRRSRAYDSTNLDWIYCLGMIGVPDAITIASQAFDSFCAEQHRLEEQRAFPYPPT